MTFREPFTFGIALMSRASAHDWALVEDLLDLTLTSVRSQTDQDFQLVIAGHDRPRMELHNPRFTFLTVDWPVQAPGLTSGLSRPLAPPSAGIT